MSRQNVRAVELFTQLNGGSSGSGSLVADNLILTAAHVVAEPGLNAIGREIDCRLFLEFAREKNDQWRDAGCSVIWCDDALDLALLQLLAPIETDDLPPLRFAQLDYVSWSASAPGFPKVQKVGSTQNPEAVLAKLNPMNTVKSGRLRVDVESALPERAEDWAGMSGAPVYVEDHLVGIVLETDQVLEERALAALPIADALANTHFREALVAHGLQAAALVSPRQLGDRARPLTGIGSEVPARPDPLISRPVEVGALLQALETPRSVVCVHGPPGTGKSTLAIELADHPAVASRFPGGVLWASLGQNADAETVLASWLIEVGAAHHVGSNWKLMRAHLLQALADESVLVVLDNVWDGELARKLILPSIHIATLVTTRERTVARMVQATGTVQLEELSPDQATALILGGTEATSEDHRVALQIADRLGALPLPLHLVAALRSEGQPLDSILAQLDSAHYQAGLIAGTPFDVLSPSDVAEVADLEERARLSVSAALGLSLARLAPDARSRFARLGLAAEGAVIDNSVTRLLWQDDGDHAVTLDYLWRKSLLIRQSEDSYRLHDVLRLCARALLVADSDIPGGFGVPGEGADWHALHATVIDKLRMERPWHALPDGYSRTHLFWHLAEARAAEDMVATITDACADGTNTWLATRTSEGRVGTYQSEMRTVLTALDTAPAPLRVRGSTTAAFLLAMSRAKANAVPSELFPVLVTRGIWSLSAARDRAMEKGDAVDRLETLTRVIEVADPADATALVLLAADEAEAGDPKTVPVKLIEHLAALDADRAVALVSEIERFDLYTERLASCLPHIDAQRREALTRDALDKCFRQRDAFIPEAVAALLPALEVSDVKQIARRSQSITNPFFRSMVQGDLVKHLLDHGEIAEARQIFDTIEAPVQRAGAQVLLLPHMPAETRPDAEALITSTVDQISDAAYRDLYREQAADDWGHMSSLYGLALVAISWKADVIANLLEVGASALALHLAKPIVEHGELDVAGLVFHLLAQSPDAAGLVRELAPSLQARAIPKPPDHWRQQPHWVCAAYLVTCGHGTHALKQGVRDSLGGLTLSDTWEQRRTEALAEILSTEDILELLRTELSKDHNRTTSMHFVPYYARLNDQQLKTIATESMISLRPLGLVKTRAQLAAFAPDDFKEAVLEDIAALSNEWDRARALAPLLPTLPDVLLPKVLALGQGMTKPGAFSEYFVPPVVRRLGDDPRCRVLLEEAVAKALTMSDRERMGWAMSALAPLASDAVWRKAAQGVLSLKPDKEDALENWSIAYAATQVVRAGFDGNDALIDHVLEIAAGLEDHDNARKLLGDMSHHMNDDQRRRADAIALAMPDFSYEQLKARAMLATGSKDQAYFSEVVQYVVQNLHHVEGSGFFTAGTRQQDVMGTLIAEVWPNDATAELLKAIRDSFCMRDTLDAIIEKHGLIGLLAHSEQVWALAEGISDDRTRAFTMIRILDVSGAAVNPGFAQQLWHVWQLVVDTLGDGWRAEALEKLLPLAANHDNLPWNDMLDGLITPWADRSYAGLVSEIGAAALLWKRIGGQDLLADLLKSLEPLQSWSR